MWDAMSDVDYGVWAGEWKSYLQTHVSLPEGVRFRSIAWMVVRTEDHGTEKTVHGPRVAFQDRNDARKEALKLAMESRGQLPKGVVWEYSTCAALLTESSGPLTRNPDHLKMERLYLVAQTLLTEQGPRSCSWNAVVVS